MVLHSEAVYICQFVLVLILTTNCFAFGDPYFAVPGNQTILSRRRRFLLPKGDGVTLKTTFKLTIPLEFLTSSSKVEFSLPFTYDFDTGE